VPDVNAWDLVDLFYVDDVTAFDDEAELDEPGALVGGTDHARNAPVTSHR
jgi:hypothetical protein